MGTRGREAAGVPPVSRGNSFSAQQAFPARREFSLPGGTPVTRVTGRAQAFFAAAFFAVVFVAAVFFAAVFLVVVF